MQSNRGRTGPEKALAALLWTEGLRYLTADGYRHRYGRRFLGQPDMIFMRKKVAIFVDGCFWHGCSRCHDFESDCNRFWREKISKNVERDKRVTLTLRRQGWKVVRVREHDLRRKKDQGGTAAKLVNMLKTSE